MIIIEVRGGVVQEVYSDNIPEHVYILDYDNEEAGDDLLKDFQAENYTKLQDEEPKLFNRIIKLENS